MTERDDIDLVEANLRAQEAADLDATCGPCEIITLPSGESLRVQGHLSQEGVEALGQIVEAARREFSGLSPDEIREKVERMRAERGV